MAKEKLQGITIKIGGDTTDLNKALKGVNDIVYKTNTELKEINKSLKVDPKNTELLAQKYELLHKNINASKERLEALKKAQSGMGSYSKLTDEQKARYRELTREITNSESAITKLTKEMKNMNTINLESVKNSMSELGKIATKTIAIVGAAVSAASAAVGVVIKSGVDSYAELEQNLGGVDTLFKDSADVVKENAAKAFETAGISANEYMQTVTSFSASLLQSLGGDTTKAAQIADMALIDMSDNANKFGTDMSSIQNAYQGFAKQNYTMLDNLKLGYGGTKSEMERLLKDAQQISGVKYDISNLSDIYNAIHVIQEELDVTGTTSLEATTTIQGSMSSMKAAFDNFLNGSGSPEQLSKSISTFVKNVSNTIMNLAPNILNGITTVAKTLIPQIGTLLTSLLPDIFSTVQTAINDLLILIQENVEPLSNMIVTIVNNLVMFLLDNLPLILEAGLQLICGLAEGIAENLDVLIPSIINCVLTLTGTLLDNIDMVIEAGLKLIIGLAKGLILAIPEIIKQVPIIILKIAEALKNSVGTIVNVGVDLVKGLWKGISDSFEWIKNKIKGWVGNVLKFIKKLFGINSPSKVMKEQVGINLGLGMVEGINDTVGKVQTAMKGLSAKVETSVNPTINPTANSNPLIIQIENFNNERETDIESLSQELEFYRKNRALANGGN
jgi:uncharacterized protein YoxC|nr:MAG TPA: tail tape measure protein [Caudoviricetes sp.]